MFFSDKMENKIEDLYSIIHKATGSLGGNAYASAMYGELTRGSMDAIFKLLKDECELNDKSSFIDIGSGLGKPNFHAAQMGIHLSIGVELVDIRHQLSIFNLLQVLKTENESINTNGLNFVCANIEQANSLNPFTHIYQFDLAFEPNLQQYIGSLFNITSSAKYLISYLRPDELIGFGYNVELIKQCSTSMHGIIYIIT